jgi:hypothetical protein
MMQNTDRSSRSKAARAALALITLMPLASCNAGTFGLDPFADAAAECGDRQRAWQPGCATKRNIAALADHPGDLDTPRGEAPRDSTRRDALISGYARSSASGETRAPGQPALVSGDGKQP